MRFSEAVIQTIPDADFSTKIGVVPYSTNPRELVTIAMMQEHYDLRTVKQMMNLLYGKRTTQIIVNASVYPESIGG